MTLLNDWLATLAFAMIRPLGLALMFPLLKTNSLGSSLLRNGVLIAFILPILPLLHAQNVIHVGDHWNWLGLIPGEMIIGVLLGFCAAIPFWAIDMAGFLIDTLRGATMGTVFNPAMGIQTSIFGLLFTQFLCALFLVSGGMNLLLTVLYDSYHFIPPGKDLTFNQEFLNFMLAEWQVLYRLCLSFSLPAVLCMVLADLALGLLNRSAQQLNVFFLSMPIKSSLALLLLLISFPYAFHHYMMESEMLYTHIITWFTRHE